MINHIPESSIKYIDSMEREYPTRINATTAFSTAFCLSSLCSFIYLLGTETIHTDKSDSLSSLALYLIYSTALCLIFDSYLSDAFEPTRFKDITKLREIQLNSDGSINDRINNIVQRMLLPKKIASRFREVIIGAYTITILTMAFHPDSPLCMALKPAIAAKPPKDSLVL